MSVTRFLYLCILGYDGSLSLIFQIAIFHLSWIYGTPSIAPLELILVHLSGVIKI